MELKFACRDLGVRCKYSVKGTRVNELMRKIEKHAQEEHGLTEEDFENPEIVKELKSAIYQIR